MTKLQSGQFINKRSTAGTQAMEKHLLHLTLMIVCYEYSLIRLRDSAKIQQNRALFNLPTYPSIRKTGRADIQTKVEELEELNQSLRQRDKVKDDAIAQLSDQLVSLSARLQEIERRQA